MRYFLLSAILTSLACVASAQQGPRPGGREEKGPDPAVREMMQAEQRAMKPLRRDLRDAALRLKDLVEDEASDKELQAGMDQVQKARKAMEARREKFAKELEAKMSLRERAMMMVRSVAEMSGLQGGPRMQQEPGGRVMQQGGRMMEMRRERSERRGRQGGGGGGGEGWGEGWTPGSEGQEPRPQAPDREAAEERED
ncbi:MAG: hypothetical protein WC728_06820 [Elusimicrobiota bacterium]